MATTQDKIQIQWATHSDPSKVGKKESVSPREARAAVRTGLAVFVDSKDAPPPRPSMATRDAALADSKRKDDDQGPAAPADHAATPAPVDQAGADTDADAAELDASVAAADPTASVARPARKR